ncbi:MAG TPA: hypothetical protein VLE96_06625 [Chlamydiales bacterium]|nr:hypothetical protein [Chlamydiales bacterium]
MKKLLFSILAPLALFSVEVQPWFGDVYQFHFLGSYAYSRFHSFSHGSPQLTEPFNAHLVYLGLDFSPSPVWSIDGDMQLADTSASSFYFRSIAFQARYLWLDDIIGDPISLATGGSIRATTSEGLRDISCPSHGNVDFELNLAFGKEFEASNCWLFRTWFYAAIGHANRGSPWVRGIISLETNIDDRHKWALFAEGINGYGRHVHVDIEHFYGYARIREKAVDLGIRYGYRLDVWGTIRLEYFHRVLAKSAPKDVNTFIVSYLLPFSF